MKFKVIKLFMILEVLLFSLILSSCYKKEKYSFQEGIYCYDEQEFNLYEDIYVEKILINFVLQQDNVVDTSTVPNLIKNRKDKNIYKVSFNFKIKDITELVQCNFYSLPKVGDQVDRYYINLDISNLRDNQIAFIMILELYSDYDYETNTRKYEANEIYLSIDSLIINQNEYDSYSEFFPSFFKEYNRIELNYIKEGN